MSAVAVRHFLLDTRAGWRADGVLADSVEWDAGPLRLRPLPGAPQPLTDASGTFGGLADPIGVAVGPDGTIVVLDRGGTRVLRFDACACAFAPLPCLHDAGAFALDGARDVAITRAGDVAITDTGNRRVLVLVGAGLAVRAIARGPSEPAWEPWGIAASGGGIVVSDHANGLVHMLDGCGRPRWTSDGSGPDAGALEHPTAIAVDRAGNVFVLQEDSSRVRVLDADGAFVADVETLDDRRRDFCPVAIAIAPSGDLCVGGADGAICVLGACDGGWAAPAATTIDAPLRGLTFNGDGQPVALDGDRCCLVRMRAGAGYPQHGRFVTTALDSGLAGCRWDRVALRAEIPTGTSVRIDTLTAEAAMSSSELLALPDARWATGQLATIVDGGCWDCLVRSGPGRCLWLRLTLSSDGAQTPSIDDAEIWFPRRTSIEELPRAFRGGEDGGDFLERYLELFDRQRATVSDQIDRVASLFDPRAVPARDGDGDFLGWLAGWVGMAFEEELPVARRRRLVREAAALYRRRGTADGVARFVSLFCGVEVRVLEHHRLRRWAIAGRGRLGDSSTLFGPAIVRRLQLDEFSEIGEFRLIDTDDPLRDPFFVYAHRFSLFLLAHEEERLMARAQRVGELAKPAHTEVSVAAIEPRLRVGSQSTIGLDTVVGAVPEPAHTGDARLGHGLVVGPDLRLGGRRLAQIGTRARVGIDTGME
jgi:phage tail-like protein